MSTPQDKEGKDELTVGRNCVSAEFSRHVDGDLVVSKFSSKRWFVSEEAAVAATAKLLDVFSEPEATLANHVEDRLAEEMHAEVEERERVRTREE